MLPQDVQISLQSRVFAEKAARSVSELQYGINSVADVVVFLEILGYDDRVASQNGFENLMHLAKYVYPFLDHYENPKDVPQWSYMEDPSTGRRQSANPPLSRRRYSSPGSPFRLTAGSVVPVAGNEVRS